MSNGKTTRTDHATPEDVAARDYNTALKARLGEKPPLMALAHGIGMLAERQRAHRANHRIDGLAPSEETRLAVDAVVLCERLSDATTLLMDMRRRGQLEDSQLELLNSALAILNG